jgi:hypothetical protein
MLAFFQLGEILKSIMKNAPNAEVDDQTKQGESNPTSGRAWFQLCPVFKISLCPKKRCALLVLARQN